MRHKKILNILLLEFWGLALATLTGVLGSVPLMFLRRKTTRFEFLSYCGLFSIALAFVNSPLLWMPFTLSWVLVFIYFELERKSLVQAGLTAVFATFAVMVLALIGWAQVHSVNLIEQAHHLIETQLKLLGPQVQIEPAKIFSQLPSIFISAMGISLWLAIVFERRVRKSADGSADALMASEGQSLFAFRVPEYFVWPLIVAVLFTFLEMRIPHSQAVALNFLNILMLLYFFQGLSIVSYTFHIFKTGPLLKSIIYAIFVTQLFLLVAILGIIDYWLNFREKLSKKIPRSSS